MGRIDSADVGPPTALISLLRHACGIATFIETGTYQGGTASWAGGVFERVITIEASRKLYEQAVRKYSGLDNVEFVLGDSRDKLRDIVKALDRAALFWLDAHWSGGSTFGGGDECPLLEELRIINSSEHEHFILIDDARLFISGPPKPHLIEQWPGIDEILHLLKREKKPRYVLIWEDVIVTVPYWAKDTVDEYRRGESRGAEPGRMPAAAKTQSSRSGGNECFFVEQLAGDGLWRSGRPLRLHLGCGEKHLDGYINIDFPPSQHSVQNSSAADIYADITKLRLPPGCADEIRLHHLFEHFDRPTAMALLCLWHGWLKPAGLVRIETPDILECARLISDTSCSYKQKQGVLRHIFGSNEAAWAVHKDGWYEEKFRHVLDAIGFADISFDSSEWKITHNITVTAKKARNIDTTRLADTAKNLLRDYLIDNSDSEQVLWRVWCKKFDGVLYGAEHTTGPVVSIFMAVHNEQKYLADTVESILNQSYTDFELIIVDDGSTDKTLEIAKSFEPRDKRVKVTASAHKGVVEARNLAIGSAHPDSKYLLNHDGDDISLPAKLQRLVDYLERHPGVGIVGCFAEYFDDNGNSRGMPSIESEPEKIRKSFGQLNSMIHSASLMRREVVRQIGGYRDDFVPAEDYDFFAQALLAGFKLANIPEVLHKIRLHPESIGSIKPQQVKQAAGKIGRYYDYQLSRQERPVTAEPAKIRHRPERPLKILHTVEFYYPHIGGAEKVIRQLSERLAERGHNVTVATTQLADRTFSGLNGVKIEQFNVSGSLAKGISGADVERYKQFLLENPADVVLNYAAQQWATDLAFDTLDATAPGRVNVIAPCGYSALTDSTHLRWPQFKEYFSQILPACLPKYDAAVYHSQSYQDYDFARNHGFGNSVIIPNGVCEEEFDNVPKVDFRRKYGVDTKYLGLCVANFYAGKGHDRIIECIRQMNRPDLTMVFIGRQGGELAGLRKLAAGLNIQFCVDIDRQDTLAAYHQADIFLFGSQIECFPLVILEAKASMTAFVSTDCGNVGKLAGGVVCPAEKMAHYANRILDDEQLRTTLARDGFNEYTEKYTWGSVVDKYERLYLSLHQKKFGSGRRLLSAPSAQEQQPAGNDNQVTALIFSKDRAMQLQATIESFFLHCRDSNIAELVVLYKPSNALHRSRYERLKRDFPNVTFVEELDFNKQVVSIVARRKYILFAVDDNIFVKPFRLKDILDALEKQTDALGFSLRLGKNTGFCYMLSTAQRMPDFIPAAPGILGYNWTRAEHDFGYPLEVSSSVYRCGDLIEMLRRHSFANPNTLESMLSGNKELFKSKPLLLTFESSVTFCNPVNIVQNVYQNNKRAATHSYTSEQLADGFSKGRRIDVEKYAGFTPNGAHQEVQLYFRPAGGAAEKVADEHGLGNESECRPEFSIVMANYNNARYISEAIESVLGQSFTDWQLIVVDDCSTDNSLQIIEKYLSDNRISLIRHETNKGYVASLKTGISLVRSRLFGILDSDDALAENALAVMNRHHLASPDCGLIYSQFVCCDENLKPQNTGFCRRIPPELTSIDVDAVSHFKTFKLDYYLKTAGFDEAILYAEDKDIIYKMEEVGKLKFVDEPLYFYREVPQGQGHLPEKVATGFRSKLNAQLNAIERRSHLDSPAGYFLEANKQFMRGRFDLAAVLMRKYRLSANYSELPRTIVSPKKASDTDVSVVIVTYNRTGDVVECLKSLAKQDDKRFEIILVDNGGTGFDVVKPYINQFVGCPVNFLLSEGRNIGACCAKGRIVAFLDDDALVGEDYIGSIKAAFKTYDIVGLRGKALPKANPDANKNAKGYDLGPNPFPTFCDLEGGSAFLRKTFLSMDGMDPLLLGHEGSDLTYRITKKFDASNKIIYWPYTVIYHDNAPTAVQKHKQNRYRLIEQYLRLKHNTNIFTVRDAIEKDYLPPKPRPARLLPARRPQAGPAGPCTGDIPVVVMVYNRPKHTIEVLKALKQYGIKNIYLFSDAPKSRDDEQNVTLVRHLIHGVDWTKPVIVERTENLGLARSIVSAVDTVLEKFDKLILLEDDCVPQKYFFDYMYSCLDKYRDNPGIFGISGYTVPIPDKILADYQYDIYFCPRIGSWGWATWKSKWRHHNRDLKKLIELANRNNIDLTRAGSDIPVLVADYLAGRLRNVWTLNWVLSVYLNNGFYIYPVRSHIKNIGLDGTGEHCSPTRKYDSPCAGSAPVRYPDKIITDERILDNFSSFYQARRGKVAEALAVLKAVRPSQTTPLLPPADSPGHLGIAQVSTTDNIGGAAKVAWMLKQGLKTRRYQAPMFVGDKFSAEDDVHIITNQTLDGGNTCGKEGLLYYDIKSTYSLAENSAFTGCDVFHFHNLHGGYFNPLALPALTKIKPSVWTLHDMQAVTGHCAYAFGCQRWINGCGNCPDLRTYPAVCTDRTARMWRDKNRIYEQSDIELVVPSQWLKSFIDKSILKNKRIHLIYNGIDDTIYTTSRKNVIRRKLKIPESAIVVGFVSHKGLLDTRKGGGFILQAYRYFASKYPNVYFLCIGGKAENAPTERFIQIPFVADENELAKLYSAMDVFLFPTLADNCPLIVLEVMGCGIPVVSFDVGGVPELIEHGKTGFIVPCENSAELIRMTEMLLGDKTARQRFGRAAGRRLRKKFTLNKMLDNYIRLYEQLAENAKRQNYVSSPGAVSPPPVVRTAKPDYLVSAIVSTYNAEDFIRGCLEDLEGQTIADKLEIIVIDSGSQQNEERIVKEFQQKYDNIVYIKTQQREGLYKVWNRAVKIARGKFLTSANTDDRHRKDALEILAKTLLENPDAALAYGDQIVTDTPNPSFDNHHVIETAKRPEYSHERLVFGCCVGSQPMWRKSLHDELGGFDESLDCAADWDFWLRVSQKYAFKHIPEYLGLYYRNDKGIEHSRKIHSLYERYLVGKRYGNPYISIIPVAKTKDAPLVSIIVPAYNAEKYIASAVESVLIQNYRNFELVIADDGSTDNTADIVEKFKDDKIRYFRQENKGVSSARNLAVRQAKGRLLIFLDADDMTVPDFIARHLQVFEQYPDASLVYCDDLLIDENDTPIRAIQRAEYSDQNILIHDLFHNGFPVVPFRTCIKRSVFDTIGFFDEGLLVAEDYDMLRRFVRAGLKMQHLPEPIYLRRITADSLSRKFDSACAKSHFEVVRRFTETFSPEELFGDVDWDNIPAGQKPLLAKCRAAVAYLAIANEYVKTNAPDYAAVAYEYANNELTECLEIEPGNENVRKLIEKCDRLRAGFAELAEQPVGQPA